MKRLAFMAMMACLFLLIAPVANAEVRELSYSAGPVTVGPYQVKQSFIGAPQPAKDFGEGFVTSMEVDVADAAGNPIPISRLMLHHIVFLNLARKDNTCGSFTNWDSATKLPGAERFYGGGEERIKVTFPPGYGYRVRPSDPWALNYMFMNHRNRTDRGYIKYRMTYDTDPTLKEVKPYWLDVKNCLADPVFDVPGGGKRGSTYRKSATFTFPEAGRLVAGGGHVHGGAKNLRVSRADCGNSEIHSSMPTWGPRRHPFYNVRPILHEPGPINMTGFTSAKGVPVAAGERLRLDANYDNQFVHTRVMGINVVYLAPDASVREKCGAMPDDLAVTPRPTGRQLSPRFKVPIVGIRGGRARDIKAPPGRRVRVRSGSTINVGDLFFRRPNVAVGSGSTLRWLFDGPTLHNVTVADGPRGFSSRNLSNSRAYRTKLKKPGTYKLFCALHPVDMTATVKVLPKPKRR